MITNIQVVVGASVAPLTSGLRMAATQVDHFSMRVRAAGAQVKTTLQTAGAHVDAFGNSMLHLNNRYLREAESTARAMALVGIAGVAGLGLAANAAIDFEAAMRNVATVSDDVQNNFAGSSEKVLAITRELPQSATDLAKGLYDIESSGIHGADALNTLHAAAGAASAGLSDTRTAARAIVTVLNAYGPAVGDATYVSDVLFKTVDVGVVTFEELAQNMGQFIGIASQMGVSIEEVGAAYATMTRNGLPAAQASTSLARTVSAFAKPSEEMSATVRQLGFENAATMLKTLGLKGSIEQLRTVTGGDVTATARLFTEIRGLRGVLALSSQDGKVYNEVMGEFIDKNQIAGATARALAQQQKSVAYQLGLLKNAVNEVAIGIGQAMIPAIRFLAEQLTTLAHLFAGMPGWMEAVVVVIAIVATSLIGLAGAMILLAPRIVATKAAMAEMALTMPRVAAATTGAATAMSLFGKALGIAGVVLTFVQVLDMVNSKIGDIQNGTANLPAMGRDLVAFGQSSVVSGELVKRFGTDFKDLADTLKLSSEHEWRWESFLGPFGPQSPLSIGPSASDIKSAKKDIDALDKSMAQLVSEGNRPLAESTLADMAKRSGIPIEKLKGALHGYTDALAENDRQAKLRGNDPALANGVADEEGAMASAAEAANAYKQELKAITTAIESFIDAKTAISSVQDRHARAAKDAEAEASATDKATEAIEAQTDALKTADRESLNIDKIQKKINRLLSGGAPVEGSRNAMELRDLQIEIVESQDKISDARRKADKATQTAKTAEEEYQQKLEEGKVSLVEYRQELERQIAAQQQWEANLRVVAKRAGELGLGPEVVTNLMSLGQQGASIVADMAGASDEEFRKSADVMAQSAKMGGEGYARELDTQMKTATVVAKQGAASTVESVLEELRQLAPGMGLLSPEVEAAAAALGLNLKKAMVAAVAQPTPGLADDPFPGGIPSEPALGGSSAPKPDKGAAGSGGGAWASGGIRDAHIAKPGPIQYAEPSTGGEAYIPMGLSQRQASVDVLADVAHQFGYQLFASTMKMASGGVRAPDAAWAGRPWGASMTRTNGESTSQRGTTIMNRMERKTTQYQFGDIYAQDLDGAMRQADQKKRLQALAG